MQTQGTVFKYPDNVDTDVIIPARYLNTPNAQELAKHCMEDIDTSFVSSVRPGDIMVAGWLRLLPGACASGDQDLRYRLCNRQELCSDLLPQCHQYWAADSGV